MSIVAWVPFVSAMVGSTHIGHLFHRLTYIMYTSKFVLSIPLYDRNPYGSSELLEHNLVGSSLSIQVDQRGDPHTVLSPAAASRASVKIRVKIFK